jgi:metal-dependent amidase/aminoacylase/carboxypeptidase family protein
VSFTVDSLVVFFLSMHQTDSTPLTPEPPVDHRYLVDALKGIGHACGHNLIAIAGVAAAISTASALSASNTAGKVVLLGTPAEENGGGKAVILDKGGYDGMEACLM